MSPHDQRQIDAYLHYLANHERSINTITSYRSPLQRAARELPDGLCSDEAAIADWLTGLRLSRNTRASYSVALRGFYSWALATGRLDPGDANLSNLPAIAHRRGLPRPVHHDQLATILQRARQPIRLWCLLAAYAGLRCCEIARLDRGDITEEAVWIRGKGDKERLVPTHPSIWAAVQQLPTGPVAGCNARQVSGRISRECQRRLGLVGVTAHRLRHWAGTYWHQASGDVRVTQQLLGHANPATTAVYTLVSDRAMRAAVLALPGVTGSTGGAADPAASAAGAHPSPPTGAAAPAAASTATG